MDNDLINFFTEDSVNDFIRLYDLYVPILDKFSKIVDVMSDACNSLSAKRMPDCLSRELGDLCSSLGQFDILTEKARNNMVFLKGHLPYIRDKPKEFYQGMLIFDKYLNLLNDGVPIVEKNFVTFSTQIQALEYYDSYFLRYRVSNN
jgi:hypothetical protein